MAATFTDTPRVARWLGGRLRALSPSLPVSRYIAKGSARQIVYRRQGGTDIRNLQGTYAVRSAWLVYVSQPVASGTTVYIEDLAADADRMHEAIYLEPQEGYVSDGRVIAKCVRDLEHEEAVFDGTTLTELQLGGIYIIESSLD